MWSFWVPAALILALSVYWLARPLLRAAPEALARDALNLRLFRERLAELEAERAAGRICDEEHAALKRELERSLLADVPAGTGQEGAAPAPRPGPWLVLLFLVLPLASLALYGKLGASGEAERWQRLVDAPAPLAAIEAAIEKAGQAEDASAMQDALLRLRALLRREPGNGDAWYALGRAYVGMNQAEAGVAALEQAYRRAPQDLAVVVGYAQTLILANQGKANPESEALLAKALALNPRHEGALMLQGFSRFTAGRHAEAIAAWEALLAGRPEDSESRRLLQSSIDEARRRLAGASAAGDALSIEIDAPEALRRTMGREGRVFVYARSGDGAPMPLAAVAVEPGQWPLRVSLGDAQAMSPARKLSDAERIVVGARWSKSGQATPQGGDIEAQSPAFERKTQDKPLRLVLDRVRP